MQVQLEFAGVCNWVDEFCNTIKDAEAAVSHPKRCYNPKRAVGYAGLSPKNSNTQSVKGRTIKSSPTASGPWQIATSCNLRSRCADRPFMGLRRHQNAWDVRFSAKPDGLLLEKGWAQSLARLSFCSWLKTLLAMTRPLAVKKTWVLTGSSGCCSTVTRPSPGPPFLARAPISRR